MNYLVAIFSDATNFWTLNENLPWTDRVRLYLDGHERDWIPDQAKMFGPKLRFDWSKIYSIFKTYFDNDLEPLDQVFMADYHGKLMYDFVPVNRKFLEHFNLIGVTPLLDPSLVDIAIRMPPSAKFDKKRNIGKIPLRDIVGKQDLKRVSDKKVGFGMDLEHRWRRLAKDIVTSTLDNGRVFEDQLINKDFYDRSLKRIADSHDVRYISKMLQLLSLEVWYRMFVTFEISSKTSL